MGKKYYAWFEWEDSKDLTREELRVKILQVPETLGRGLKNSAAKLSDKVASDPTLRQLLVDTTSVCFACAPPLSCSGVWLV